ncbi:hypothetical protein SOCEGT47_030480 [Sorangium cellulosum]|uniref:Uncharacterized protein n=1 Tax=Sorangium cellulosum TaxID=56 RepID=A0A4P2Q042_SORCE|nr:hypothetical protein SOCEGT47_030480 [Sorangium cellulosum]
MEEPSRQRACLPVEALELGAAKSPGRRPPPQGPAPAPKPARRDPSPPRRPPNLERSRPTTMIIPQRRRMG